MICKLLVHSFGHPVRFPNCSRTAAAHPLIHTSIHEYVFPSINRSSYIFPQILLGVPCNSRPAPDLMLPAKPALSIHTWLPTGSRPDSLDPSINLSIYLYI